MKIYLVLTVIIFLGFSCQGGQKPVGQELRFNMYSEPPSLDPRRATDTSSIGIINLCFEGLAGINTEGKAELALAQEMKISEDQMTYTFILKDALWSNGQPVTASDFVETWRTMLKPDFPCQFAYDLYIIKNAKSAKENKCPISDVGLEVLDDKTLKITLEHPIPYFLDLLASHSFLAVYEDNIEIANGPFQMAEWRHNNEITLVKNEKYWDASKVILDKINFSIIEDVNTELNLFENGQLDWAGKPFSSLPADALQALAHRKELHRYSMCGTYYYVFNTKLPPFNNVNLRRAFALAINRQSIIANITQEEQDPATGLIPAVLWKESTPLSYFKDADLEEARRYYRLALQEIGTLPEITLIYNTLETHHKIAQAIQEQWFEAFGIRVKLQNMEWKVFLDEVGHHQFQIARMGGIASFADPISFLDHYRYETGSNNFSCWTNPEFSKILGQADLTTDPIKRFALLKAAEKILIDEMPIAPIYFYTGTYLKKPDIKDVYISEMNDLNLKSAYRAK